MAKDKIAKAFLAITKDKFTIDTIAEMIATKHLAEGDIVRLNGYYSAGDGANHIRIISKTNDGSGVLLNNGLYANLTNNTRFNTSWVGSSEDIIQTIIDNFVWTDVHIEQPDNYFSVNTQMVITVDSKVTLTKGFKIYAKNAQGSCRDITFRSVSRSDESAPYTGNLIGFETRVHHLKMFDLGNYNATKKAPKLYFENVNFIAPSNSAYNVAIDTSRSDCDSTSDRIHVSTSNCYFGGFRAGTVINLSRAVDTFHNNITIEADRAEVGVLVGRDNCKIDGAKIMYCDVGVYLSNDASQLIGNMLQFQACKTNIKQNSLCVYPSFLTNSSLGETTNTDGSRSRVEIFGDNKIHSSNISFVNCSFDNNSEGYRFIDAGDSIANINLINCTLHTSLLNPQISGKDVNVFTYGSVSLINCTGIGLYTTIKEKHIINSTLGNVKLDTSLLNDTKGEWIENKNTLYDKTGDSFRLSTYNGMFPNLSETQVVSRKMANGKVVYDGVIQYQNNIFGRTGIISNDGTFIERDSGIVNYGVEGTQPYFGLAIGSLFFNTTTNKLQVWNGRDWGGNALLELDTPYHASNMQKLGILDSYYNYLSELHEYEKSQNVPEGVMSLNVVQPPVTPKEIEEYAKEYNLI